ncbi:hypothetical protein GCM10010095_25590 [Streptomyces anthocyanicus]|uniref:hypothetical protein n=1 Tax=Streptomyces anthocyanicus TaxID=68174 RepID=UPI00166F6E93|nr:hypothetical protein [Streptomyces anthocyanicus]GGL39424.1 hypothetical protein GCM10010095_25590 [Streptomyces anthocyanicus]
MSMADGVKSLIQQTLDNAMVSQQVRARKNVERLRRVHPGDTPQELICRLDRSYLTSITASRAARIVPGSGAPVTQTDTGAFTESTVQYLLSLAEVYGLHSEDLERRQLLGLTVLFVHGAGRALGEVAQRTGHHWGRRGVGAIPASAIKRANKVLGPRFITKSGTKHGVLVLDKHVPLGVGAVIGTGGDHVLGRLTIKCARSVLGQPPASWTW